MKYCTLCKNHYHIIPFQSGFICEECIKDLKKRDDIKTIDDNVR